MNKAEKKRHLRWMFYFLIQLPIATCAIRGITIPKLFPLEKNESYVFKEIPNGTYTLYSTQEAKEVGSVEILNKDNEVDCSIVADAYNEVYYKDSDKLRKVMNFSEYSFTDYFHFEELKKNKFLICYDDKAFSVVIIVNIKWDNIFLPDKLKNNPLRSYYFISEMDRDRYNFICKHDLNFEDACLVSTYEQLHSYLFFVDR